MQYAIVDKKTGVLAVTYHDFGGDEVRPMMMVFTDKKTANSHRNTFKKPFDSKVVPVRIVVG